MSQVVYNPTNEDFKVVYAGLDILIRGTREEDGKFVDGDQIKLQDAAARHALNEFGRRGLVALDFGDDLQQKRESGIARNREFKIKQVTDFNQDNERRQSMKLAYVRPTKEVKQYSEELGIDLVEPYHVPNPQKQDSGALKEENRQLKQQIQQLVDSVGMLQERLDTMSADRKLSDAEVENERRIAVFKMLTRPKFKDWVEQNRDFYLESSVEVQTQIVDKWNNFFAPEEKFPY